MMGCEMERVKKLDKASLIWLVGWLLRHNHQGRAILDRAFRDLNLEKEYELIDQEEKAFEEYLKARTAYGNFCLGLRNAGHDKIPDSALEEAVALSDKAQQKYAEFERLQSQINKMQKEDLCG